MPNIKSSENNTITEHSLRPIPWRNANVQEQTQPERVAKR